MSEQSMNTSTELARFVGQLGATPQQLVSALTLIISAPETAMLFTESEMTPAPKPITPQ